MTEEFFSIHRNSIMSGKLATNELPLVEPITPTDPTATTTAASIFTNPLTISEDSELDTTSSSEILRQHRSPMDKK